MNPTKLPRILFVYFVILIMETCPASGQTPDGTLDPTFGEGGKVITQLGPGYESAYGVAIQSDGKILAVGESYRSGTPSNLDDDIALVRYNTNGSLDNTFGTDGIVITPIGSGIDLSAGVVLQPDGKIVVGGEGWDGSAYRFAALRYNSNGSLDNSFGSGGIVITAIGTGWDLSGSVVLQPDGRGRRPIHVGANR